MMTLPLEWSREEEKAFADIARVGNLTRMEAIRLFKRCHRDTGLAIQLAKEHEAQRARMHRLSMAALQKRQKKLFDHA